MIATSLAAIALTIASLFACSTVGQVVVLGLALVFLGVSWGLSLGVRRP